MQDSTQLLQQYGDGDEGAADDDGGGDDDDPDEVHIDGGVDGDDLPSPGRNSPGRNLSPGDIFLSRCFPLPKRGGNLAVVAPRGIGVRREDIGKGEESRAGQVGHTCPRRGVRWARA